MPIQLPKLLDGAICLHHSSILARPLLRPRGQTRSTSTRVALGASRLVVEVSNIHSDLSTMTPLLTRWLARRLRLVLNIPS